MESSNYPYAELVRALLEHLDNDKKNLHPAYISNY